MVKNYNGEHINVELGSYYTAMGTCGMTDGIEVSGKLTKIDGWGAYLEDKGGQSHLCNRLTLKKI